MTNQALLTELSHSHITSKEISFSLQWKPVLFKVTEYVLTGWPDSKSKQLKPYHYLRNYLSIENSCLLWGNRVTVLLDFQSKMLGELHVTTQELTI